MHSQQTNENLPGVGTYTLLPRRGRGANGAPVHHLNYTQGLILFGIPLEGSNKIISRIAKKRCLSKKVALFSRKELKEYLRL